MIQRLGLGGRLAAGRSVLLLLLAASSGLSVTAGRVDAQEDPKGGPARAPAVKVRSVFVPRETSRNLSGEGGWVFAALELETASSSPRYVVLEGRVGTRTSTLFTTRKRVEVPPGAPRREWIYLRVGPNDAPQTATVLVLEPQGGLVAGPNTRTEWDVAAYSQRSARAFSTLVVGEKVHEAKPWGRVLFTDRDDPEVNDEVDICPAGVLPDRAHGYQGLDMVVLRDLGPGGLSLAQVEALRQWVHLGGFVVFVPAVRSSAIFDSSPARELLGSAIIDRPSLDGFVPRALTAVELGRDAGLNPPRRVLWQKEVLPVVSVAYTVIDRVEGSPSAVIQAEDGARPGAEQRLFVLLPRGAGQIGILTIDDETHTPSSSGNILSTLWGQIARWRMAAGPSPFLSSAARFVNPSLEREVRDSSRHVGLPVMTALIAIYIFAAGPGLFVLLKWKRRLTAVIWAQPLLVAVYVGIIFATAYVTKGVLTKTRLATFIHHVEGDNLSVRESYLSVFSAAEDSYRIESPRGILLQPLFKNAEEERPVTLSVGAAGELSLGDISLAHWQEAHFVNAGVEPFTEEGVRLEVIEGETGTPAMLKLMNGLPAAIRDGIYYYKGYRYAVPAVARGASAEVPLGEPLPAAVDLPRIKLGGLGVGAARAHRVLAVLIERDDADFHAVARSTLKERLDYYIQYK
ncbi:MAG TPA: hypothetical protein VMT52_04800 [Planctomycetota bacterium]|nr:hypothetical protein [Planctomycetota bacterium]